MNALVRNTTVSRSRRFGCGYEDLSSSRGRMRSSLSGRSRKSDPQQYHYGMRASSSYRRERAKHRQIYLKTYKLASVDTIRRRTMCLPQEGHNNKLVMKVKKVVASMVLLLRIGAASLIKSSSSCDCPSSVRASSPSRLLKPSHM